MKYITFRCDNCNIIRKGDDMVISNGADRDLCKFCVQSLEAFIRA